MRMPSTGKMSPYAAIYPQLPQSTASSSRDDARQLIDAVIRNDKNQLVHLLQKGADPNSQTPDGETALHAAAKQETARPLVERLLQAGADANQGGLGRQYTPVHCAAIADRAENLRALVEQGGDLYRKSADGRNALDYAERCRSRRVLAFLREHLRYTDGYRGTGDGPVLPYAVPIPVCRYTASSGRERPSQSRSRSVRSGSRGRVRERRRSHEPPSSSSSSDDGALCQSRRGPLRTRTKMWTSAEDICAAGVQQLAPTVYHPRRRPLPDVTQHTPTAPEETLAVHRIRHRRDPALTRTHSAGWKQESVTSVDGAFGVEMTSMIEGTYGRARLQQLEHLFRTTFNDGGQYGNYLLLDPQITQNLPYQLREAKRPDMELCFRVFLRAIFAVGTMPSWQRPLEPLRPAKIAERGGVQLSQTLCRIRAIWARNYGVVVLQCFPFVTEAEAHARQALMVEAIGRDKLTAGDGGGEALAGWRGGERRLLGGWLLRKAFGVLLEKGERQVFREEV